VQGLEQVQEEIPCPSVGGEVRTADKSVASTSELRCEVATEFAQLQAVASEWDRLWESDLRGEIFQTFGWAKAWWRAYGEKFHLCSLLVYEGKTLIGVVPLVRRGNVLEFLGVPQADYADMICEESRAAEVLAAAFEALNRVEGWNECSLEHVARHSRIARHSAELPPKLRRRMHVVASDRYQTIVLRENRDEVFKQFLGKNHTKRRQNKLQKAGRLQFRFMERKAEAQQYLSDFFRQHVRRRAVMGRASACANPEFRNFLRALVEEVEPGERLRFGVLELNDQPMGWGLGFQVNGKFLFYQHTFDLDTWDYSPGEVVLWNLLEYARQNVTREFDFGKGEEAYKNRFTNYAREMCAVYVERPGVAGAVRGLRRRAESRAHRVMGDLKGKLQAHRPTLTLVRAVENWTAETLNAARRAKKDGSLVRFAGEMGARLVRRKAQKNTLEVFVEEPFVEDGAELAGGDAMRGNDFRNNDFQGTDFQGNDFQSGDSQNRDAQNNDRQNNDTEVQARRLGDLVDLALERPDRLALAELPKFRQRLKRGDRVYVVREKSQITLIAWVVSNLTIPNAIIPDASASDAKQPAVKAAEANISDANSADAKKPDAKISNASVSTANQAPRILLMDECTPFAEAGAASYRALLSFLRNEAAGAKAELMIQCPADQTIFLHELQRQGFQPKRQTVQYPEVG
jgi:CelD/BcsL family acetyltransferase involved in cellulose biosynthesis